MSEPEKTMMVVEEDFGSKKLTLYFPSTKRRVCLTFEESCDFDRRMIKVVETGH